MGVGLTLVRRLVEKRQGAVTAESDGLGQGSQFVVRLPLASQLPPPSPTQPVAPVRWRDRVALVEDNPDSVRCYRRS